MFAALRSPTNSVASCSYRCSTRLFHGTSSQNQGLRQRNWHTAKSYPAPEPLMPKKLTSIPGFEGLSRRNVVTYDEDSVDLNEEEDEPASPRKPVSKLQKREPDGETEDWRRHAAVMKKSFPAGWQPPKKLSRDAMEGLRLLNKQNPDIFTTPILAEKFRISPEAVRRILKSKWEPSRERRQQLAMREKDEMLERSRAEYLEEAKSRIEAIAEKRQADKEESDRYWIQSGRPEGERLRMERQKSARIRRDWLERQSSLPSPNRSRSSKDYSGDSDDLFFG
ncbi:hypothetical protein HWV62_21780 [Athelia sp. TMB]|nr:hypothetical protein HWV62_21780 [Athelia sp. TMB]